MHLKIAVKPLLRYGFKYSFKVVRHLDSIALDALCMDINEYQFILSASIWVVLLHLVYYKNWIKTVWKNRGVCLWCFALCENILKKVI